jgi:hypothetical protein
LLPVQAFQPELHFADPVFAYHRKCFFTGPGNVQQVTDQKYQDYKKPHRKHDTSFNLLFPNTVPINVAA